ncbi:MAG: isochorismatase family protein [Gammaproteobacteria bacterium]|nr:isochorismatase family protein [Gammaproteobacteria bacterium]MCP5202039.1 isochorismatase family protein [Gammaproteobacteria bacterium]
MANPGTNGPITKCNASDSLLLVIDIQQRLGDAMPGKVLNRVLQNSKLLCSASDLLGIPVVKTEQYPAGLGPTHAVVADVLPAATVSLEKVCFSCCDGDGFAAALAASGRRQVVLVGMEAHVCVLQTALDLAAAGHEVFVVEDAICSRRLENYQNALDRLRQCGVVVVTAESVVFEWMGTAGHEHFKAIHALLR